MQRLSVLLASSLLTIGCYSISLEAQRFDSAIDQVFFSPVPGKVLYHFNQEEKVGYTIIGTSSDFYFPDASILRGHLSKNRRISNLAITVEMTAPDVLMTVFTLGYYQPRTVLYEGDVVDVAAK